ncbi:MAG: glycosyltransferase family 39 protein [Candidatus Levybacteria bacterium]|nr:glycosyltransferase family 39 protein [Candidatus Levybacteria bacterium]
MLNLIFRTKNGFYSRFLFLLCLLIFISHTLYVIQTKSYPEWDEHKYLGTAVKFLPILRHPDSDFFNKMLAVQRVYLPSAPPLYPLMIDAGLLLAGTSFTYKLALWINGIFYILTILGVYFLAKEFVSKRSSVLASVIFAFYGFPLFYIHFAYTETAATAFTILSLCFLAKSNQFSNTRNVALFSLFFALGFFTRWTVPIFIVGPLVFSILSFVSKGIGFENLRIILKNIAVFAFIIIIPLLLYYIPNYSFFSDYFSGNMKYGSSWMVGDLKNSLSPSSLVWYHNIIAQQTVFFYLMFLGGFFLALRFFKKYLFILLSFLVPYIVFSLGSSFKDDRFIVPIYPVIAIISVLVFDYFKKKKLKKTVLLLTFLILTIGFFNFLGASWGIGPMKFSISGDRLTLPNSILLSMPIGHPRRIWLAPISWPPRPEEGNASLILDSIRNDWNNKNRPPKSLQTFELSQIGTALYSIVLYEEIDAKKMLIEGLTITGIPKGDYKVFFKKIKDTDYVLVKNGVIDKFIHEGESKSWDEYIYFVRKFNIIMQMENSGLPKAFVPIKKISVPIDKSTLTIYRKKREITEEEWRIFANDFIKVDPDYSDKINNEIQILINNINMGIYK